ncbi:MAG: hypothetical protein JXB23_18895, partial [Candidatus Aminicenantes bacterium]|nr:hypothetical protein [Candidatus Aminicenantes bacterium]
MILFCGAAGVQTIACKIFQVNDGDLDNDGIADFCDGFSAEGAPESGKTLDTTAPAAFGIPMMLTIRPLEDGVPFSDVKYTFHYIAS